MDFDPETVRALRHKGVHVRFGDGEDAEFAATLPLAKAQWVVSTLPVHDVNTALLDALRERGFMGKVAMVVRGEDDADTLARRGVAFVFRLYDDTADFAAGKIEDAVARD